MDWTTFVMFGGVCLSAVTFAFGWIYVLPRSRVALRGSADEQRCNGMRELCVAAGLGGFVLFLVGTIANDVRFAPAPVNPAILLGPGAFLFSSAVSGWVAQACGWGDRLLMLRTRTAGRERVRACKKSKASPERITALGASEMVIFLSPTPGQ